MGVGSGSHEEQNDHIAAELAAVEQVVGDVECELDEREEDTDDDHDGEDNGVGAQGEGVLEMFKPGGGDDKSDGLEAGREHAESEELEEVEEHEPEPGGTAGHPWEPRGGGDKSDGAGGERAEGGEHDLGGERGDEDVHDLGPVGEAGESWEIGGCCDKSDGPHTRQIRVSSNLRKVGRLITFADDVMCSLTRNTKTNLTQAMKDSYDKLENFCETNKLKLNAGKTHFIEILSPQKYGASEAISEVLYGRAAVEASKEYRVLGVQVSNKLCGWRPHVDKVLQGCAKKMCALKLGGKHFSFKQRLATGKGVHMSKILYCLEAWGPGLTKGQIKNLQACQNKLTAWITNRRGEGRTELNLRECNLLSVNQSIVLRVLLTGLRVLQTGKPEGLSSMIRQTTREGITTRSRGSITQLAQGGHYSSKSWRSFFLKYHAMLPAEMKTTDVKRRRGRKEVERWVRENVDMFVD